MHVHWVRAGHGGVTTLKQVAPRSLSAPNHTSLALCGTASVFGEKDKKEVKGTPLDQWPHACNDFPDRRRNF